MLTLLCGSCGNPAAHSLKQRVTKFTLFFVPLFPISSKYSTQCTFCGAQQKLTKEQADQLQAQNAAQLQPQPGAGQPSEPRPFGQQGASGGQNPYQS